MKTRILITTLLTLFWEIAILCQAQADPAPTHELIPSSSSDGGTYTFRLLPITSLHVGKATLTTEIASTPAQQERGLMYRTSLPDNQGMIFLLPQVTTATFWMKNTLIPLSIAFIDKNGVILEIHDMKAQDETITRSDSDQIAYALETNLHWFALNGVKLGDKIDLRPAIQTKLEFELRQAK